MKSRTSFSNLTPFKKNLTRFVPLWALYLIAMLMVLFQEGGYYSYDRFARNYLMEFIGSTSPINLVYAGLCGVVLFSDLYNTRMCYSLHAMPQRREVWYLSHAASAFVFSLAPNLLITAAMMVFLQNYWYLALYWLLAATLQFVFYFGMASLAAFLVGNRVAMVAVYAGLNFVSMLVYVAISTIYAPMMTGVEIVMLPFAKLCPAVFQVEYTEYFRFESIQIPATYLDAVEGETETFYQYLGLGEGWGYMVIMALVGVAAMAGAIVLYRKRHLECADDFIAFPKLNPVATVIITICVGMLCAYLGSTLFNGSHLIWLAVGVVVGYFGGLMLIERRVKVFRPKTFLGFGAIAAILVVSILAFASDAFGIVSWTPEAEKVESVTVSNFSSGANGYYNDMYGNRISVELKEKADIEKIITAHENILANLKESYEGEHQRVVLSYKLENGRTVRRSYSVSHKLEAYKIVSGYFYTPEQVLGFAGVDWEEFASGVTYMWTDGGEIPAALTKSVMEALKKDCENGKVTTEYTKDNVGYVEYQVEMKNGKTIWRTLYIREGAENTLALLKSPACIMGAETLDQLKAMVRSLYVDGEPVETDMAGLLEAMWKDAENGDISSSYDKTVLNHITIELVTGNNHWLTVSLDSENTLAWLRENGFN